ncbi:MAG: nitroreductase family protein [Anaerolineales bacterium]|nr:nitroreductase family protein [Anaerolineales bacterium]
MIYDIVKKTRSYRRFVQEIQVDGETLSELVNLARLSAATANIQPLKYITCCDPAVNAAIFSSLRWAGYLKDWGGPAEGERPSAYIIMLGDTEIRKEFGIDPGIAAQSIMLGATDKGLGGCMIASIDRKTLRETLEIPDRYEIVLVLALGKPNEQVIVDELGPDGDIKYYRDADDRHHVPKRALKDILLAEYR